MKSSRLVNGKAAKRKAQVVKPPVSLTAVLAAEKEPLIIVLLVVVVFLCYANTLGNDFVFDDIYLVVVNQQLRHFDLTLLLSSYRPLRDVSYAIDYALWGEGPFGFHLSNIIIHAANVVLVYALIRRLTADLAAATLAALIFAVHPLQTDAVSYISGRRDLLFSLFYLLSFHSYITYYRTRWSRRSIVFLVLFLVLWALSLMSKEMAVTLPVLIFVWHYCDAWTRNESWLKGVAFTGLKTFSTDKWLWIVLTLSGLSFTAYYVFVKVGSRRVGMGKIQYWGGSFFLNLLTVIRVQAWYLKQLVYPTPIAQYLGAFDISESILDWRLLASSIVVGVVLFCGFVSLNRNKLLSFAIFSYFALLLPVSQIIPHHELLADHYLYLPLMSFGLGVALVVKKLNTSEVIVRNAPYVVAFLAVLILATMTVLQNRSWKNERTVWEANYKAVPNSPRAAFNLAYTYQETEPEKAEQLFKRALELNPPPEIRKGINDRLAVLLIQSKKFDEAEFFVGQVLMDTPNDFFGNLWLTQIHISRKECDKARTSFLIAKAAAVKPREQTLSEQTRQQLEKACGN